MPPESQKTGHDIIVVGASAGGVEASRAIVASLPRDLPAAVSGSHLEIPAVNRRGRHVMSHVSLMPLVGGNGDARGLIVPTRADGVDGGRP